MLSENVERGARTRRGQSLNIALTGEWWHKDYSKQVIAPTQPKAGADIWIESRNERGGKGLKGRALSTKPLCRGFRFRRPFNEVGILALKSSRSGC